MKINMLTENYQMFEKTFLQFYDVTPLYSLVDDLAGSMSKSGNNYFKLPAKHSKDGTNHYFYFKKGFDKVDREEVFEFDYWE